MAATSGEGLGRATGTVATRLGAVTIFYRWLHEKVAIVKNLAAHIKRPSVPIDRGRLCGWRVGPAEH